MPTHPLLSGQIGFLVQKDAQCFKRVQKKMSDFFLNFYARNKIKIGFRRFDPVAITNMQTTPPPQKLSYLHERGSLSWIKWKINLMIFAIFVFEICLNHLAKKNSSQKMRYVLKLIF